MMKMSATELVDLHEKNRFLIMVHESKLKSAERFKYLIYLPLIFRCNRNVRFNKNLKSRTNV